ncbi:hypothetical protein L1887_19909 [Cichorium endivia]|nr:hypothetical protein L1887_19909 [Cichorium endivia]
MALIRLFLFLFLPISGRCDSVLDPGKTHSQMLHISKQSYKDAKNKDIEDILILSGDHLYRMNYLNLLQRCRYYPFLHAGRQKVRYVNKGEVVQFAKKPKDDDLKAMVSKHRLLLHCLNFELNMSIHDGTPSIWYLSFAMILIAGDFDGNKEKEEDEDGGSHVGKWKEEMHERQKKVTYMA